MAKLHLAIASALAAGALAQTAECPVAQALLCDPKSFIEAPSTYHAKFETDRGDFVLEVSTGLSAFPKGLALKRICLQNLNRPTG